MWGTGADESRDVRRECLGTAIAKFNGMAEHQALGPALYAVELECKNSFADAACEIRHHA
jgi:hypothetical protein